MEYRTADRLKATSLSKLTSRLMLQNDQSLGSALGSAAKLKMQGAATRLASNFDPLNLVRLLTFKSPMLTAAAGKLMGRSKRDISYFTGGLYGSDREGAGGKEKSNNRDGVHRTKIGPGKVTQIKVGDGTADLIAKLYNLTRAKIEYDMKMQKISKSFSEEQQEEYKRFMEDLFGKKEEDEDDSKQKNDSQKEKSSFFSKLKSIIGFALGALGLKKLVPRLATLLGESVSSAIATMGRTFATFLTNTLPRVFMQVIRRAFPAWLLLTPSELGADDTFDAERAIEANKKDPATPEQVARKKKNDDRIAELQKKLADKNTLEAEKSMIGEEISKLQRDNNKILQARKESYRKNNPFVPSVPNEFQMNSATGNTNQMADLIRKKFKEAGFPDYVGEAAVVNAYGESGLNPTIKSKVPGEESYGLFQANREKGLGVGSTIEQLKDPNYNIDLIIQKALTTEKLKNAENLEQAIEAFVEKIEVPADITGAIKERTRLLSDPIYKQRTKPVDKSIQLPTADKNIDDAMQKSWEEGEKREKRISRNKEMQSRSKLIRDMNSNNNERLFKGQNEMNKNSSLQPNINVIAPQTNMSMNGGNNMPPTAPINRGVAISTRDNDDSISWLRKRQGTYALA
jgi:hypothetical protein